MTHSRKSERKFRPCPNRLRVKTRPKGPGQLQLLARAFPLALTRAESASFGAYRAGFCAVHSIGNAVLQCFPAVSLLGSTPAESRTGFRPASRRRTRVQGSYRFSRTGGTCPPDMASSPLGCSAGIYEFFDEPESTGRINTFTYDATHHTTISRDTTLVVYEGSNLLLPVRERTTPIYEDDGKGFAVLRETIPGKESV